MAGIYLHIPFCKQKCNYCNFHFSTSLSLKEDLLHAMHEELKMQSQYLEAQTIETIYIGGGTPSLLTTDELNKLFETIQKSYPSIALKEFTLEANPDDLTNAYLKSLRNTPINRFSIGVQSFKEADLLYMNRAHNAKEADYAIKAAQDAGFSNITIDLIYGTPGLTHAEWRHNLDQIKTLQLPHFSAYALTVEEGTVLHHSIQKKKAAAPDNEQTAQQFELLTERANAMGFEHYEISNLALPGHYAVHNTNYWKGKPYLGIGPSAHSFDGKTRRWNIANNALYTKNILQNQQLIYEEEKLTAGQRLNEYIMTSLRTMWGCNIKKIREEWDNEAATAIIRESGIFQKKGQLVFSDEVMTLTPKGKLFADGIAGALFVEEGKNY